MLFSEGIDYDIDDVFNNRGATTIMSATQDAIAAATRANVAIYGIDARGLGAGADDLIEVQDLPNDPTLNLGTTAFYNEVRLGQDSLRVLSSETGGFALVNTNDFNGGFERLVADNSAYYLLGYYSTQRAARRPLPQDRGEGPQAGPHGARPQGLRRRPRPRRDREERRQDARRNCATRCSARCRCRGCRWRSAPRCSRARTTKGAVVVSTLVAARDLPLTESGGTFTNRLDVVITATDYAGKSYPGDRYTLALGLKPDSVPQLRAGRFPGVSTRSTCRPAATQLRVAALEDNTSSAGSVVYDLDVPDFSKEPLSMSGLALTSASSSFTPTARSKDPLAKMLPGPLTTYREFVTGRRDGAVRRGLRQHRQAAAQGGHRGDAQGRRRPDGLPDPRGARQQRAGRRTGRLRLRARIPLKDVAPGLYVLRVQAQSQLGDQPRSARETIIRVLRRRRDAGRQRHRPRPASTCSWPRCCATSSGGSPAACSWLLEQQHSDVRAHAAQRWCCSARLSAADRARAAR